ncbi:MAG: hypothetical protein V3T29_07885 [Alphaproteobacteria bacterium]
MVNLAAHAEVLELLAEVEAVAANLTPNELEMLSHLKSKYAAPDQGDFDDKICLEVMLRNVAIRKGYTIDPKRDAGRVIEVTRTPGRR